MRFLFLIFFTFNLLWAKELIYPLPLEMKFDRQKALLGKKLYSDPILSKDNTISCSSCHNLYTAGVDNLPHSFGIKGQKGNLNTPTVLNSYFNFRQMWDGRAKTLQHQAVFPITNPVEMGNDFDTIVSRLEGDKEYKKLFKSLYKNGVTKDNIVDALAEFQKTLVTPSPFDAYLRGDEDAISQKQKEGYELFKKKGCISCHNGINVGGASYSRLGIVNPHETEHFGLYNVTKNELDKFFFKVPGLRNVELTYPYFHDGDVQTLKDAIKIIAQIQLGVNLKEDETELIEEFLKSLTGKLEIIK